MPTLNNNVKKKIRFAMPFEDLDGGGEYCGNKEADPAVIARGRAAIAAFSLGEL